MSIHCSVVSPLLRLLSRVESNIQPVFFSVTPRGTSNLEKIFATSSALWVTGPFSPPYLFLFFSPSLSFSTAFALDSFRFSSFLSLSSSFSFYFFHSVICVSFSSHIPSPLSLEFPIHELHMGNSITNQRSFKPYPYIFLPFFNVFFSSRIFFLVVGFLPYD